jgi:hypothetical protein
VTALLWVLAVVGAWNAVSLVARICYGERWWPYWWHVLVGVWSACLLVLA